VWNFGPHQGSAVNVKLVCRGERTGTKIKERVEKRRTTVGGKVAAKSLAEKAQSPHEVETEWGRGDLT